MFANIAPFKLSERVRKARLFKTAQDKLYTELTERFQANSSQIQSSLEEAIQTAKTPRDFRTPIWTYNRVQWTRSYSEARAEYGDEFGALSAHLHWVIDDHDYETRVRMGSVLVPVQKIMKAPHFLPKLGAFFGDHFTVSLQTHKVLAANEDFTAVEVTVYLNYWSHKLPATVLRLRTVEEDDDVSHIQADTSVPWCRVEGGQAVWYPGRPPSPASSVCSNEHHATVCYCNQGDD
jgi:hypothetical protein